MPLRKMIAKLQEKWSGRTASRRAPRLKSRRRLELELLETRDLMAATIAPKILSVAPPDGGSLVETSAPNVIKVTYSEAMDVSQASNAANYLLFGPAGAAVPISSVVEEGATNTYDVAFGAGSPTGAYTLFVKGDQVHEVTNLLTLAGPGQLVVANSGAGSNTVSTVRAPDGFTPGGPTTLGATQTYAMGPNASGFFSPNPIAVVTADFNGDGNLDLAIVSTSLTFTSSSEVDIYTGKASGGFDATPARRLPLPNSANTPVGLVAFYPTNVTTGFADLAVLDAANNVNVFTNTGTFGAVPTFNLVVVNPTKATRAVALVSGDFNRDGATDLAVLDAASTSIDFLPGNFSGTFGVATVFALPGGLTNATSIAVGSLKTAGSQDLAVGGSNGVLTLFNNGTFVPTTGALIGAPLTNITSVAIGNLDGDSGVNDAQDIAALSGTSVEVLTNMDDGTGAINPLTSTTFALGAVGNALALSPQSVGGKADIVVANSAANEVTVLQNTSTTAAPTFAAAAHYTVDANPVGLAIGKLNGDGSPDIVTVNNVNPGFGSGGTFSVLRNNGDGTYGAPTTLTAAAAAPDAIAVGDLNGDGIPDLVVANKANNTVTVYLASSTTPGTYLPGVTYSIKDAANKGSSPVSVVVADLTGTGKLDIITANSGDNTISILANNGDGTFTAANTTTVVVGLNPTQIVAGKFDNSGHVSLAVSHNGGGASVFARGVSLLLGNGDRTFKPKQEILPGINAVALVAGNFTSAVGAPLDLVVADTSNGTVDLLRNNGLGVFTHSASDVYAVGASPSALAAADFNRDGLQDVVVVSRDATGSAQQIAVLLNSGGGGFAAAVFTPLPFGFPVNSVAVTDINGDAFPDLVVGLTGGTVPGQFGQPGTPADANLYSLIGNGDGTFTSPVPYQTGPKGNNTVVAVASDPEVRATTFTLVTNIVAVDLIKNGGFEAHDLNGTPGNFIGWQTAQTKDSRGGFYLQSGTLSPLSLTPLPPPAGGKGANVFRAVADQSNLQPLGGGFGGGNTFFNPNAPSTYSGSNFLYQDITLPASATTLTFSLDLVLNSDAPFTDGEASLFFNNPDFRPDQQVRIDFIDPNSPITTTDTSVPGTGVLLNLFQTTSATPQVESVTVTATPAQLATLLNGTNRRVRLRIAVVNTQGRLTVGVDNVSLKTQFTDLAPPLLSGPQLRNPGYQLPGVGNQPFSTTDPTLTGQVSDNGGVANIKKVVFSPFSAAVDPNFNMAGDAIVGAAGLDATGHFTVTLSGLAPSQSPVTIRAKVIDNAGISSGESTITFLYQGPSVTNFQAVGPGPIDIRGVTNNRFSAVQYSTVVGRINSVVVDPTDPTGNTYLTAGDNGGIWRTTDGGVDWTPTTDYIFNPHTGAPINVPVGAMGGAINHVNNSNNFVVYAGLGSGHRLPDSRAGNGVLVSTNGGVSWAVAGNSDTVLAGARVSKVVVDPNNTNIAYVAVESGGSSGPGVYKTSNGGQTWANVLTVASIGLPPPANSFPAGTKLASVTDLAINPFDSGELTVALGNIGLVPASATAGVYRTVNGGSNWVAVTGGSTAAQRDTLPGAVDVNGNLTAATSLMIGRVTLAYAAGITNDTSTLYVLVTSPPLANPLPGGNVDFGNGKAGTVDEPLHDASTFTNTPNIYGLYKSGNQTLGVTAFTHVQVREQKVPSGGTPDIVPWSDVNFSNVDASNSGAIVVDPTDPNVVYIGGSEEYGLANAVFNNHGLLRIDTGNMVDTSYLDPLQSNEGFLNTGDDITKRIAAYDFTPGPPENKFEYHTPKDQGYLGEGVAWLDVTTNAFNNDFGFGGDRLPPNITSVAFDSQNRIVFGTEQGVYRLVYHGTGYDFTSGGQGIIATGGFDGKQLSTATVPTSTIQLSQINGNLQIADLTSAALDPTIPNRLYTTQYNTGAATTSGGLTFTSSGLVSGAFNPFPDGLFAGIPDGARVVVAQPDPTTPAGTLNTIYEIFAFGDIGSQENFQIYSSTQGGAFQSIFNVPTAGLGRELAGYLPVLAIDPNKILQFIQPDNKFEFEDELLFGTDRIYVSRTSGAQFNPLSAGPLSTKGGLITAAAFAPSNDQVIWAVTDLGEVFVTVLDPVSKGYSFKEMDAGLPPGQRINSVTVDPNNSAVAYITETTAMGVGQVFVTTNDGVSWTNITGNLPAVNVNTLVTDPRPQPGSGAPIGHLYVGTDVGAYVSVDGGVHWKVLGVGLPHVPVVDLQFNRKLETLVAATQGRGAFEISTDEIGAHVVAVSPANPVNPVVTPLSSVTITFNKPIASFPLSAVDFITGPGGAVITPLAVTDVSTFPPGFPNPHNVWQITFAPQTADGTYTIQIGPNILDQLGHPMDQNQNAVNGENPGDRFTFLVALNSTDNGQFVTGQYHDALGRPADTNGFITILGPIDAARYAALQSYAFAYVRDVGRPQLIQDLYGTNPSILGIGDLIQRAAAPFEVNFWLGQFQAGLSYEQMIVSLASSPTYFSEARINGNDGLFVTAIYQDLFHRAPSAFEHDTLFVPQLFNAEAVSRTQDARTLLAGQPYQTIFIQSVYNQFLNRDAGSTEVNVQLNRLSGGYTQEQVIASLLGTQEYYSNDAPAVVGGGAMASNATLIRAMYKQLFPGYAVSQSEVDFWVSKINNNNYTGGANPQGLSGEQIANILDTTSLYRFGATGVVPTTSVNGSVDRAYFQFLSRHANQTEINYWSSVYNANPNYRTEDLYAAILGSPEYFAGHTTANPLPAQDQQFADALYTSVLGAPNSVAEQTHDLPFLASAEYNARNAIGQAIVASGEYHDKLTTYVYQTDLGRAPSPFELSLWRPIVGQSGAVGGPNGDEQLLDAIFSSPEYFLHQTPDANHLHTNDTWLRSLYANLHAPFNAAQEAANLNGVSVAYAAARLTAIRAFQGSAEYVNKITTDAYNLYLGRFPGAGEITYWLNRFQAGATREQEIAQILSSGEYFNRAPLILGLTVQPSNKTFVDAAYLQLFPGYAITQSDENTFVNPLNAGTMTRFQVATTLVGADLYRFGSPSASIPNNGFIPRAYMQYLGRAIVQPEIDYWRSVYANNPAYLTEDFLAVIFDSTEYLVKTHQFP
jgi:FG-GAP-like repeat